MREGRRSDALAAAGVALAAFLPFLRGTLSGASLYFRDLSLHFLPLRRFALEGLRSGEVRFWNPLLHEGVPLPLPSLAYPLDLVQLLRPDEAGISLVLALHVPLAALAFLALARGLGLPRLAAAGGSLVYALGGFLLSTVNLYVHLQAVAWAPLLVLGLVRVVTGTSSRAVAATAFALAVGISTTGIEIVVQAVVIGLGLGVGRPAGGALRALGRATLALALGTALAAPVLVLLSTQVGGSARGGGFDTDVVLAHSVHPFTLVQTLVGGLYGDLSNLAGDWWGQNFFPRGFPYVLSLYLGAAVLSLAAVGVVSAHPLRARLTVLVVAGVLVSLGRWVGLAVVVDALPILHLLRYPVKAFFTAHFAVALLAALGLATIGDEKARHSRRRLAIVAGALGVVLAAAALAPAIAPRAAASFAAAFFPRGLASEARTLLLARVLGDAAVGGAIALAVAAIAAMTLRSALAAPRAALLVLALAVADLLRTGSGLNPMVTASFFRPSPELESRLASLRAGRLFTCSFEESPTYLGARLARGTAHEAWSFALLLETLTPAFNVPLGVVTAMSPDLTMLAPVNRILSPAESTCRNLDRIVPRLRQAAVQTVLSVDPLLHPDLEPDGTLAPRRLSPLVVRVYRLRHALPRLYVATEVIPAADAAEASHRASEPGFLESGHAAAEGATVAGGAGGRVVAARLGANALEVQVETEAPTVLVVRDGWAAGWTATVDGHPAPIFRANGRHRAVPVPAGRSLVVMRFVPPRLAPSLAVSALAAGALLLLARPRRRAR